MRKGFTLLEIAIVLVIVGILLGLVINGRALIETVQVKAEIYKLKKIRAAYATFVSKYGRMPGEVINPDLPNATHDSLKYGTKEAITELINEGLISEKDFQISIVDGAYWNIYGCMAYEDQKGIWVPVKPYLSRNICLNATTRPPLDDDMTKVDSPGTIRNSLQFICHIETQVDDKSIKSGLGRAPVDSTDTTNYDIDFANCYSMSNAPITKYYSYKVF